MNAELDMAVSELANGKELLSPAAEAAAYERLAMLAYESPVAVLSKLEDVACCNFPFLRAAVIAVCRMHMGTLERDIRSEFYSNLAEWLPGAEIIAGRRAGADLKPDGFIRWKNADHAVEIKRGVFDAAALKQLQRYMHRYECECGIAVAPELGVTLPAGICFVQVQNRRKKSTDGH